MSAGLYKAGGVLFLALAIGAVALAFQASNRRAAIQGPSAIAVLPDRSVWLSVEDALWRFDAQGRRVAVVPAGIHGVDGLIANLVVHPGGRLVASMRNDPDLHFLDPASGAAQARMRPRWPADLERHGDRAITYDFHPDGRLAVATGGGHAVALFDADGRFLARTAPGTYEFSNGLWWSADSLWTTDTNRFALVELDGRSLAVKSRVTLRDSGDVRRYLGMAAGRPREPDGAGAATEAAPLGSVVRFASGMIDGNVVDVLASGAQRAYPVPAAFEPRDLKWRGDELLVVDGASYAVKRFSMGRQALPDFGDPAARNALSASLLRRASLQARYHAGLAAALAFFAVGALLAWRSQALEQARRLAAMKVDMSQMGTIALSRGAALRLALGLVWPMLVVTVPLGVYLARSATDWPAASGSRWKLLVAVALSLAALATLVLTSRRMRRAAQDPEIDALLNQRALHALVSTDAFWRLRDPDEMPRETLMMPMTAHGLQWLVLTNQRLLVFAANLRDFTLRREYPRRDVLRAQVLERGALGWRRRVQAWLSGAAWLRLEFRDGTALEGATPASRTALRLCELLRGSTLEAPSSAQLRRVATAAPGRVPDEGRARAQTVASLLVPGAGQWMQGRGATALLLFVPWLGLVLAIGLPLFWTLWGPRSAVPAPFTLQFAAVYAVLCCVAAVDAWRMRRRGD